MGDGLAPDLAKQSRLCFENCQVTWSTIFKLILSGYRVTQFDQLYLLVNVENHSAQDSHLNHHYAHVFDG